MSSSQKAKAKKRLNEAEKRDKRIEKLKQLQNDYETLIYSSRDFLEEEENSAYFKSEDDKEKLKLFLNEAEAWLYGAGSDSEFDIKVHMQYVGNFYTQNVGHPKAVRYLESHSASPPQ